MSFEVVYVEDEVDDWKALEEAVKRRNRDAKSPHLRVKWARDPQEMKGKLGLSTSLILADVYFPSNSEQGSKKKDRLDELIRNAQEWTAGQQLTRPLPIVAYTSRGKRALEECLRRKSSLYDIWDKSSASPDYVAWRLSEMSKELSRMRPDALTQRLIREMRSGASWHEDVVDMTRNYDAGWTEYDQIERAGESIKNIASKLGVWKQCEPLWKVMTDWEYLDRAVSRRRRGHARHVINVFWLGYLLLHNKHLRSIFTEYWQKLIQNRSNMEPVADDNPLEALSNSWFFAGLFHDVGGCVEKAADVDKHLKKLISVFGRLSPQSDGFKKLGVVGFMKDARPWLVEFDQALIPLIEPVVKQSVKDNEPDQGVVGAIHLRNVIKEGKQRVYALEGGRAMSMHNIFPKLKCKGDTLPISWKEEPMVCLLLLCDQLQTWDRETGAEALNDSDQPTRAELSALEVELENGQPVVRMSIDYIAPAHLDHSYEIYTRVKNRLKNILRENPFSALQKVKRPWPFKLVVKCTLSGEPLEGVEFG